MEDIIAGGFPYQTTAPLEHVEALLQTVALYGGTYSGSCVKPSPRPIPEGAKIPSLKRGE